MNDLKGIIEDCNKSDLVSDKVIKKVIEIIGQEEWQILHDENNDVCTTMGELIITLEGIAELEKENTELKADNDARKFSMAMSEKVEKQLREENTELRKVAEFQQSSNINKYFENKKLKEGLAVGSTFNKALNSMNKNLIEKSDKYRNMVFDKDEQLTKAKEIIKKFVRHYKNKTIYVENMQDLLEQAEQFLNEVEK